MPAELNKEAQLLVAFNGPTYTEPTANQNDANGIDIIPTMGRRNFSFTHGSEVRDQPGDKSYAIRQSLEQVSSNLTVTLDYDNTASGANRTSVFYDKDWADCKVWYRPVGPGSGGQQYVFEALVQANVSPGGDGALELPLEFRSNGNVEATTI